MSGKTFRVTAAYITLRVDNELGQEVLLGFHQGATLPEGVNQEDLDRHVRKNMVAEEGTREADLLAVPAGTPVPGEPPNVAVTESSALNLSAEGRGRRAQESADTGQRGRRSGPRSDSKTGDEAKG
ncbi:hypothetical protein AB0J14_38440 [Micromonospora arborensis]|uniref:hypothetical protein n=1 Tax=Micromonospora arborensis TaxID=2116518 RepID=UPI003409DD78